jgi:tRNA(Ile)-lysidine synthase
LRHDFLARTARQKRISRIALAHHLDDQVELFFLRLFRGAGIQGLAGMKWRAPSPARRVVELVRPLLGTSKAALLEYAAVRGIEFRHDASNDDLDIQRNRIRHRLLPLLEGTYQPGLRGKVARLMDVLGAESAFIEAAAQAWLRANRIKVRGLTAARDFQKGRPGLDRQPLGPGTLGSLPFETLPLAVQRRCLQDQVIQLGVELSYELIERLRLQPGKSVSACGASSAQLEQSAANPDLAAATATCQLVRGTSGVVRLVLPEPHRFQAACASRELDLRPAKGRVKWDGVELDWQVLPGCGTKRPGSELRAEFFDADAVGQVVRIRHWQRGDRFQPIGMPKPVKLQDLFVNQKVPRARRHRLVVATTAGGEIFWVEGLRISDRFKLTMTTIRRLHWRWQRL